MNKYKTLFFALFLATVTICFYLQNLAVPFFADDYKWIGQWQLRHQGFGADLQQIVQTQWEFCHLENGRLFCHAMVQLLVSWGEPLFDLMNAMLFPLVCGAIVLMSFEKRHWSNILPWLLVVIFLRYLIAEDTSLLYWACGSMNYLLPTGMTAIVVALLLRYQTQDTRYHWWYPAKFVFSILAGWEHEIIVLPVAFAMWIFVYLNWKKMTPSQWLLVGGYCLGAFLVLIAPANFHRINGPVGMAEGNWLATIAKRIYLVIRFGYLFDILSICLVYWMVKSKNACMHFIKEQYFWFCSLASVFLMGIVLGTDSRMRWGIDLFSLFLLLSIVNRNMDRIFKNRKMEIAVVIVSSLVVIHQLVLVNPFFDSWQTYRDAEKQCVESKEPVVVRVEDWHSDSWPIDAFVAHPYHLLKEDAFVFLPHSRFDCKSRLYDYMSKMSDEAYSNMPESGVSVCGEYVMPATAKVEKAIAENKLLLHLDKMSLQMDNKPSFLVQHIMLQYFMPAHYPLACTITPDIVHFVEFNSHRFICLDKPFSPVWRDINNVEILEK
ncbi:MAG: hypothetical protein IJP70_11145 [Bacteroidales bacterium]|nr:hypothetical protein [Bacteroidales bacterium]